VRDLVERLTVHHRFRDQVVFRGFLPSHASRHADPGQPLPGALARALAAQGIERLWSHQARALDAVRDGRSTLVVTPTASGKSLVYLLPTLEAVLEDPQTRALYLFPYKALARDQLQGLRDLAAEVFPPEVFRAEVYDGDTSDYRRRKIRRNPPQVLLTNPDMLHLGILAHHEDWAAWFRDLRLVVLDEAHVYRGVFGSHVHHVLQRLRRVARLHGARPVFVASSATVGEPGSFIESLVGEPFAAVTESGAPRAGRHLLFLNPRGLSPYTVARDLFAQIVGAGRRVIAFTKARRVTELIHFWLTKSHPELAARTAAYRAGYLPEERRDIERRLFGGELDGVIATSALEHGIDVGGLDACILVGYPGSVASTWQRVGRSGRSDRESLAVLVAMPDALDQYVVAHPEAVTEGPCERVVFDPDNETIARSHLVCAGAESPLQEDDREGFSPARPERIEALVAEGRLVRDHEAPRWYSLRRRPQREVHLRSGGRPYSIVETRSGRLVGTLDAARAFLEGHQGAIYMHGGTTFLVRNLDLEAARVEVEPSRADYYTVVYSEKETEILETLAERRVGPMRAALGQVRVTVTVREYGRRRIADQQEISRHPLDLPPMVFETIGFWLVLPEELNPMLTRAGHHFLGSLHATEHAAIGLFPLLALCDRHDLGGISYAWNPQLEAPGLFVYDGYPGGVGLARTGYDRLEDLLERTRDRLRDCPCEEGCPGCVQSPKCGSGNRPLDKAGSLLLLEVLTGQAPLEESPGEAVLAARAASLSTHRTHAHRGTHAAPVNRTGQAAAVPETPGEGGRLEEVRAVIRPDEGRVLFFDLETLRSADEVGGWSRVDRMGLALACVYDARADRHRTYHEPEVERLLLDLLSADLVVGFNVDRFDLKVLEPYAPSGLSRVRTLDLLSRIHETLGFRLSLGHLAGETLEAPKTADGLQSLAWVRQGRLDLVEAYCRSDVELTARLFAYGRRRGYLLYRDHQDRRVRVPVSW
jgi:DEAD/DEAH box helicase domain-containing protein